MDHAFSLTQAAETHADPARGARCVFGRVPSAISGPTAHPRLGPAHRGKLERPNWRNQIIVWRRIGFIGRDRFSRTVAGGGKFSPSLRAPARSLPLPPLGRHFLFQVSGGDHDDVRTDRHLCGRWRTDGVRNQRIGTLDSRPRAASTPGTHAHPNVNARPSRCKAGLSSALRVRSVNPRRGSTSPPGGPAGRGWLRHHLELTDPPLRARKAARALCKVRQNHACKSAQRHAARPSISDRQLQRVPLLVMNLASPNCFSHR